MATKLSQRRTGRLCPGRASQGLSTSCAETGAQPTGCHSARVTLEPLSPHSLPKQQGVGHQACSTGARAGQHPLLWLRSRPQSTMPHPLGHGLFSTLTHPVRETQVWCWGGTSCPGRAVPGPGTAVRMALAPGRQLRVGLLLALGSGPQGFRPAGGSHVLPGPGGRGLQGGLSGQG